MRIDYRFWIWKQKLPAVLTMLALSVEAFIGEEEIEAINYSLLGTNDGRSEWAEYVFEPTGCLQLKLALDEEDTDIIHLIVTGSVELCEQIKLIDAIQNAFSLLCL